MFLLLFEIEMLKLLKFLLVLFKEKEMMFVLLSFRFFENKLRKKYL